MKYILLIAFLLPLSAASQIKDDLENRINGLTTIIESSYGHNSVQGSGFFYYLLGKPDTTNRQQQRIDNIFLITNRHVIFQIDSAGNEHMPDYVTFYLRNFNDTLSWSPIVIPKTKLKLLVAVHRNPLIDIAIVNIQEFLPTKINVDSNLFKKFNGVLDAMIPNKSTPIPQVTDDVVVVGYPNGYYDYKNLFPIVKSGMIASKWGASFNGKPYFLIDSKLFPGSSGSLVLSKPSNFSEVNGEAMMSAAKQYTFLGIYSGNQYDKSNALKGESYNVGIVWYSYLIEEIIKNGVYWQ